MIFSEIGYSLRRWRSSPWLCGGLFMFGLALFATARASDMGSVSGRVIDVDSNRPLADVMVVQVRYQVAFPAGDEKYGEGLVLTRTDATGRFHFDRWTPRKGLRPFYLDTYGSYLVPYRKGYKLASDFDRGYPETLRLKSYDGTFEKNLANMLGAVADVRSTLWLHVDEGPSIKPLMDQIMADATSMAATPEQLDYVNGAFRRRIFNIPEPTARPVIRWVEHQSPTAPQSAASPAVPASGGPE